MSRQAMNQQKDKEDTRLYGRELARADKIATHWMRSMISHPNVSLHFLLDLILKYYFIPRFEWDPHRTSEFVKLSNGGTRFTSTQHIWQSVCSLNAISAKDFSIVSWELTLKLKPFRTWIVMGYIDSEYISEFDAWKRIGKTQNQLGMSVFDGGPAGIYTNDNMTRAPSEFKIDTKVGDRIRLEFDFKAKKCNAFYNDEEIGLLTDHLPHQIYLAVSVYGSMASRVISFETTLFEAR